MAGKHFYVVGGEYADTSFSTIAAGKTEERYGPFLEKDAYDTWRAVTGKTVDNALIRYRIKPAEEVAGDSYFVVGGEYASTAFDKIAAGRKLESYGPFSRSEALAVWRAITSKTVDDAMVRYAIVSSEELEIIRRSA